MKKKNEIAHILGKMLLTAVIAMAWSPKVQADCKYERMIDAEEIGVGVLLNWATCLEQENSMFIVEKSSDGLHFINLGAVKGAGHSTAKQEYSFLDVSPGAEKIYYRLRQINFSGTYSFSEVLAINKKRSNHFMVSRFSAVEAANHFEVQINASIADQLTYTLLDWKGNALNQDEMLLQLGQNQVSVDLTGLPTAIYRLELQVGAEVETLTFQKVKEADLPQVKAVQPCDKPLNVRE